MGDWPRGFADFEFRLPHSDIALRLSRYAPWTGQDLGGKSILVHSDGAFGDLVQFGRYLHRLAQQAAGVTLLAPEKFHRILTSALTGVRLVSSLDGLDGFDYRCELMSLPFQFKTDVASIPPQLRLGPSPTRAAGRDTFDVGICWQGNPTRNIDRGRSIPLAAFRPVSRIPGVHLVSL